MSEASDILRSYVRLVARLSGAASVSLYVPPAPGGQREILIHEGRLGPLPELADPESAAECHHRLDTQAGADDGKGHVAGGGADGLLYRIPLRWVMTRPDEEVAGPERRKRDARTPELTAPIGLRFDATAGQRAAT
jgi:hypothetical protein